MLSKKKNMRLWYITATWQNHTQTLRKEFIMTAPDEQTAKTLATNRLPTKLLSQPDKHGQIRIRDLGNIENEKTYFSSDPFVPNTRQDDAPQYERVILYAKMWGAELGWRTTNQTSSTQDDIYLQKMKNEPNLIPMLNDWAEQSMYDLDRNPEEFFLSKISEYLGTKVLNITDMIPVSDQGYEKLKKTAELEAKKIVYEATQEANRIKAEANALKREVQKDKTLVEQMLKALQNGTPLQLQVQQNVTASTQTTNEPEPSSNEQNSELLDKRQVYEDKEEPIVDESTNLEETTLQTEENITETNDIDPEFAPEMPIDDPIEEETTEEEPFGLEIDQNMVNNNPFNDQNEPEWGEPSFEPEFDEPEFPPEITETDIPEVISETTVEIQPDQIQDQNDNATNAKAQTEEPQTSTKQEFPMNPPIINTPEYNVEEDMHKPIDEQEPPETTEIPKPQKPISTVIPTPTTQPSPIMKSSDTHDVAIDEIMKNWQIHNLRRGANNLKMRIDHPNRKISRVPALEMWKKWIQGKHINQNLLKNKKIEVEYFIEFIKQCEPVNGINPLQYVYDACTGNIFTTEDQTVIE